MNIINNYGVLSPQQESIVKTADKIYKKVCNQNDFFEGDIKHLLKEIKDLNDQCKTCFSTPMYTWQADHYSLQMHLENKYEFIFNRDKLTWTQSRWRDAIEYELALHFYKNKTREIYDFQFRMMCCWLMLQYFKSDNFKGEYYKSVIDMSFQIVENIDDRIRECIVEIVRWRKDNATTIQNINFSKKWWRKQKSQYQRLVYGKMKSTEVEFYHMIAVCNPGSSFDDNISRICDALGLSFNSAKRRAKELGLDENNLHIYLNIDYDECKAEYDKEYRFANKVLTNTLTKKEKKKFWQHHTIYNEHLVFRTFGDPVPDLLPADNPLETLDDQVRGIERAIPRDSVCLKFSPIGLVSNSYPWLYPKAGSLFDISL